jgi:hypothetical protein
LSFKKILGTKISSIERALSYSYLKGHISSLLFSNTVVQLFFLTFVSTMNFFTSLFLCQIFTGYALATFSVFDFYDSTSFQTITGLQSTCLSALWVLTIMKLCRSDRKIEMLLSIAIPKLLQWQLKGSIIIV